MKTLALQMSDAYPSEGFTEWLLSRAEGADILDLRGVEGTCCYCDGTAKEEIGKALPAVLPRLRWIDGGDYHYLTHLLALREKEPFWMVLMDNHPDNQEPAFDGVLSCGSWVKAMEEENGMLRGVLTIGPEGCMQELPEGWADGKRVYISLDKDIMSPEWARTVHSGADRGYAASHIQIGRGDCGGRHLRRAPALQGREAGRPQDKPGNQY